MQTIIVTRHPAVEKYIRESDLVPQDTPCYPSVTENFVQGKHIIGIVPMHIAAAAELFTEVKITLRRGVEPRELSLDELRASVKQVRTYSVEKINIKI